MWWGSRGKATAEAGATCSEAEADDAEQWEYLRESVAMKLRYNPHLAGLLLCAGRGALAIGQSGTTIWWLLHLTASQFAVFITAGAAVSILASAFLNIPQLVATVAALSLAALPVMNIYSAVALLAPAAVASGNNCDCWKILHLPAFFALATTYLADSLPLLLKAEYGDIPTLRHAVRWSARASKLARMLFFTVAVAGCGALILGGRRVCRWITPPEEVCTPVGPLSGQGFVICLHTLSLVCAAVQQCTLPACSEDMVRLLLQLGKALAGRLLVYLQAHEGHPLRRVVMWLDQELQRLSSPWEPRKANKVRALVDRMSQLWSLLEEFMPTLRNAAPPRDVVAVIVAVRYLSPMLAPAAAIIVYLEMSGYCPRVSLLLVQVIVVLVAKEAFYCRNQVPEPKLQRLALLVPSIYLDPFTRTTIGYCLSAAKHLQRSARGVSWVVAAPRKALLLIVPSFMRGSTHASAIRDAKLE